MVTISPRWADDAIPVVFASDAFYIPYLAVAIYSLIAYASPKEKYDIIILTDARAAQEEKKLQSMCTGKENISIRCIDMADFCAVCESFEVRNHLSVAAYYRLFISSICAEYDKILYMDCDVLCHADVAELYHMDLGDNLVAAAYDRPIQDVQSEWLDGARAYIESIGMKDAKQCFNSGVLLMNLRQMREENTEREFLRVAAINKQYWHDQSVLNICCQNRVLYLPESWNFTTHMYAPEALSLSSVKERMELEKEGAYHIIHYAAGRIKPWQTFASSVYRAWWEMAVCTPYYDIIRRRIEKTQDNNFSWKSRTKTLLILLLAFFLPTQTNMQRSMRRLSRFGEIASVRLRWQELWKSLSH